MEKDLISIIIPIYNTEQYLEKCIQSVLNQTYKKLEIICVDDGSTDNSRNIVDKLALEDKRIRVFHTENKGSAHARNVALKKLKGEYIGFVDSDDYLEAEMYETLLKNLKLYQADVVTCKYYIDTDQKIEIAENLKSVPEGIMSGQQFLRYVYERDVYKGVAGYLWTRLIKSELVKDRDGNLKLKFDEHFKTAQDILFIAQLNLLTEKNIYEEKPLYHYYQRVDSVVHNKQKLISSLWWAEAYEQVLTLYKNEKVEKQIIDIICRMYVYRCGKLLEIAIEQNDLDKKRILQKKIKDNLFVYVKTNMEHLERVRWILSLLFK